jgi:hypothetical protein
MENIYGVSDDVSDDEDIDNELKSYEEELERKKGVQPVSKNDEEKEKWEPLEDDDLDIEEEIKLIEEEERKKRVQLVSIGKEKEKSFLIETLEDKPVYDGNFIQWNKLPRTSLPFILKVYEKKSNAGKILDIILVESAKIIRSRIGGKCHFQVHSGNNIWIPLVEIYKRTYRDKKRIYESVETIAKELDGLLFFRFVRQGKMEYLVLNIKPGLMTKGIKNYLKVLPYDYSLTNAELIFLRQLQNAMGPLGKQILNKETLLQFGKVAWGFMNNTKKSQKEVERCLKKLRDDKRILIRKTDKGKWGNEKYFILVLDEEDTKQKRYIDTGEWQIE